MIFGEEWDCRLEISGERRKFIDKVTEEIKKNDNEFDILAYHKEIQYLAMKLFNEEVRKIYIWIPYLYISFQEWIKTIIVKNIEKVFEIEEYSAVVSFNYTDTMEAIYQQKEVLHLHGFIKEPEDVVLGFHSKQLDEKLPGLQTSFTKEFKEMKKASAEHGFREPDSNKFHDENIGRFYKPVNLLKDSISTFVKNKDIDKVIVIGHSYNSIDWVYFNEIVRCVPEASYLFTYYSEEDRINIQRMISDNKFHIKFEERYVDDFKVKNLNGVHLE